MNTMMRIVFGLGLVHLSVCSWSLDATSAVKTFQKDAEMIRMQLQNGKMTATQAQILLMAIELRQNNVIILQNAELLQRKTHE